MSKGGEELFDAVAVKGSFRRRRTTEGCNSLRIEMIQRKVEPCVTAKKTKIRVKKSPELTELSLHSQCRNSYGGWRCVQMTVGTVESRAAFAPADALTYGTAENLVH
jgi:hypothetical protein